MRLPQLASLAMLAACPTAVAQTPEVKPPDVQQSDVQHTSAAISAPVSNPNAWRYAPLADGTMGWMAQAKPGKTEGSLLAQRFMYFPQPKTFERKRVQWIYDEFVIDCKANTFRQTRGLLLDKGRDEVGKLNSSSDPTTIGDKTPEFILRKMYCEGLKMPGALEAGSLDLAMDAVGGPKP